MEIESITNPKTINQYQGSGGIAVWLVSRWLQTQLGHNKNKVQWNLDTASIFCICEN